ATDPETRLPDVRGHVRQGDPCVLLRLHSPVADRVSPVAMLEHSEHRAQREGEHRKRHQQLGEIHSRTLRRRIADVNDQRAIRRKEAAPGVIAETSERSGIESATASPGRDERWGVWGALRGPPSNYSGLLADQGRTRSSAAEARSTVASSKRRPT